MNVKEAIGRVRKAIAVAIAGGVVVLARQAGVDIDSATVETLVTFGLTALAVYLVPNAKPILED